jgi:hypothetical protein
MIVAKRITEKAVWINGELMFLRSDGLYGTDEQREIPGVVKGLLRLLMAEVATEEGQYVTQINEVLKDAKINGALGICLEL